MITRSRLGHLTSRVEPALQTLHRPRAHSYGRRHQVLLEGHHRLPSGIRWEFAIQTAIPSACRGPPACTTSSGLNDVVGAVDRAIDRPSAWRLRTRPVPAGAGSSGSQRSSGEREARGAVQPCPPPSSRRQPSSISLSLLPPGSASTCVPNFERRSGAPTMIFPASIDLTDPERLRHHRRFRHRPPAAAHERSGEHQGHVTHVAHRILRHRDNDSRWPS